MHADDRPSDRPHAEAPHGRLDSWKEVAAYLRRDIKTAQRWERREGLPVHRLQHDKAGSVYAYVHELDAWLASRRFARHSGSSRANGSAQATGGPGEQVEAVAPALLTDVGPDWRDAPGVAQGRVVAAAVGATVSGTAPRAKWPTAMLVSLAAIVAVGTIAAVAWLAGHEGGTRSATASPVRFLVGPPPDTTFAGTFVDPEPAVSPDGNTIVFRAAERDSGRQWLYLRRLAQPSAEALPGTEQAIQPFWSRDSRQVAFFASGDLRRVDLATRRVSVLARAPRPEGGAWLASGDIVFNPNMGEGLYRLPAGGGPPIALTKPNPSLGELRHVAPEVAEDGRQVLYLVEHGDPRLNSVWVSTGRPGEARRVAFLPRMGRVFRGGWFLYFRSRQLVAQRLDLRAAALSGDPQELGEALEEEDAMSRRPGFSVSSAGAIAYWPVTRTAATRLTWFDREGRELGMLGTSGDHPFVAISPDGGRAAVQRVDEDTWAPDIWLFELGSGAATRLTATPFNEEDPVWSPDGRRIVIAQHPGVGAGARLRLLSPVRPLVDDPLHVRPIDGHPTDWSHDGRRLVFQATRAETKSDVLILPLPDGDPQPLVESPFNDRHGRLSPGGRYLAYSSDMSGRLEVYVKALEPGGAVVQLSNAGGSHPRWRRDGRELFYVSAGGLITSVPTTLAPLFSAGRPTPMFDARPPLPLVFLDTFYDVTADGQRFLVAAADRPITTAFTVVVNGLSPLRH